MARYAIDNLPQPVDVEQTDPVLRTLQNCKNLLMTRMGEVPYDRLRGFDPALLHLPMTRLEPLLLPELDRVMGWEPDAEVVSAEASVLPDGGVLIRCVVDIDIT